MNEEQRPGWHFAHAQDDLNLSIFCICSKALFYAWQNPSNVSMNTVEPRYLKLAYFELPLISKWKSGPYFNMKIWQQVKNNVEKRRKEQFLLFSTLFYIYIFLTSGVKLHIHLLNVIVQFIVFLTLSTLICRGTNISKYFSESLGIRDNEGRLYI